MLLTKGRPERLEPHDHVVFETDNGWVLRFNDARRFGMMDLVATDKLEQHKLIRGIGPEPLGNDFNGPVLAAALKGKKTSIKAAILDQKVVAGVGNIYASEALYRARISPKRLAYTVQGDRAEKLAHAIKTVLNEAVAAGGSSLRDYVQADGELGFFQDRFAVYGLSGQPCRVCAAPIERITQANRTTFYCRRCQR
jgi:formamidopyrimidine-DNA glycosylase